MASIDDPIGAGIPASDLSDLQLMNELASVHRGRNDALRHGSDAALAQHTARTAELEAEYLVRYPEREVDAARTRAGARNGLRGTAAENVAVRTGADQPWDPVELAVAMGLDPTPVNVERARRILDAEGPSAIERIVP